MKNRFKLCSLMIVALALAVLSARADEQADYNYREQYGPANVIWMRGLLKDYNDGRITESEVLGELWAERPATMATLYTYHEEFNACLQSDLVYAESNGVKFTDQLGHLVFYDTSIYLDGSGHVIPGYQGAYNRAVRANSYLNDAHAQFTEYCPGCPMNNKCCKEHPGSISCDPNTGKRCCNIDGEVNCTQTQGNPCS